MSGLDGLWPGEKPGQAISDDKARQSRNLRVRVHCGKCGSSFTALGAITQYDCLDCGFRIVGEELPRPDLKAI